MSTVRIGLVGCGGFQRHRIANLFPIPEARITALMDIDPAQIELTKLRYPQLRDVPTFDDLDTMLARADIDAVFIATPHTLHHDQIVRSFEAGKHVLCEKPLVTSVVHAHDVIRSRDRSGKVGMVSYQRHFQAEYIYIREAIIAGRVGAPTCVQALNCQEWKRFTAGTWRQDPALSGGGQLNDTGSHLVDILMWVTGLRPAEVRAFCDNRGTPVDIDSSVAIRFEGGALGTICIWGDAPAWYEDVTIGCERGAFLMRNGKLSMFDESGNYLTCEGLRGGSTPDQNFIDVILGRAENLAPFECGLRVAELTEAAWRSAAQGGVGVAIGHASS